MGRTKRIILLTILFLCVFSILFVYKFITENSISDNSIYDNAEFTSKYNNDLKNCGWIPNWASKDGLASLKSNSNILDCISPVLYEVKDNGSLNNISPANLNEIISYAKSKNIKIYPTITLFDYQIFTKVLQNTENYQRHIDELLAVANNPAFDGIDLDYESTQYSDNDQYKKFVIELSSKLHEKSKKLIITVLSKWGDDVVYASLPETRHVQDWRFLSDYADYIRIMAYDYTYWRAKYPGPIAPLQWVESIIKYAKTKIPDEKIVLGVHLYSYQWSSSADSKIDAKNMPFVFMYDYVSNIADENSNNASYDYGVVQEIINDNQGYAFDYQGEKVFVYQKETSAGKYENRVLVYIDQTGIIALKKLAAKYNLYGVVYWRLGNEKTLIQDL